MKKGASRLGRAFFLCRGGASVQPINTAQHVAQRVACGRFGGIGHPASGPVGGDRIAGEDRRAARLPGLTNHRIGDTTITSTARNCGAGPEVVLPNADWTRLMAATPKGTRDIGPLDKAALKQAAFQ